MKVGPPFHLYLRNCKGPKATQGLLLQAGLDLCRKCVRVCVQGCDPAFGTGQVSEGDKSPGSPQNPMALGYPAAWLTDASTECASAGCSAP